MLVLILLLLNLAAAAHAQVASSTLPGEVRDGSGAMIPGARVMVSRISTGFSRESTTNPLDCEEGIVSGQAPVTHHR